MSSQPVSTASTTGLPAGVEAAPLSSRFLASLIDAAVPIVVVLLASVVIGAVSTAGAAVVSLLAAVLVAAWFLLVWWMFATRAAGPGMRLMKLQLVGLRDGRPIGYARFFLRALVLAALAVTGVGLVLMLVFLVRNLRKQGWHDLAADSVVIKERALAPNRSAAQSAPAARATGGRVASVGSASSVGSAATPVSAPQVAPIPAPSTPMTAGSPQAGAAHESPIGTADSVRIGRRQPASPPAVFGGPTNIEDGLPIDVGWFAVLDDGREIGLNGLVLLGRNPQARPGEDDAELIKVADETRTVSKTHLALSVDDAGLTVMDRGSTNGTTLTDPTGGSQAAPAGDVVALREGSIVSFGDHWLKIEHRA